MREAEVVDAFLERTVVFPDATVANARVSDSVLDEASVVKGVYIDESVVGSFTQLRNEPAD